MKTGRIVHQAEDDLIRKLYNEKTDRLGGKAPGRDQWNWPGNHKRIMWVHAWGIIKAISKELMGDE